MDGSFGPALSVIALLAGFAAMLRGWWARRNARRKGRDLTTPDDEKRRASAAEMERRMASYLAGRDTGG
jgi:hypothetical protein